MKVPDTHYVPSGEILIAYQVHGSGDQDLLLVGGPASNVETIWTMPEAHRLFERLGSFARVIRLDRRDTGVSDPYRDDLTFEAHVSDALAVMDAVGSEQPVLIGSTEGARTMAVLAAAHPDRAAGLLAIAPGVRGGAAETPELAERLAKDMTGLDWPNRVVDIYAPEWADDPELRARLTRYIRTSATPRQAQRLSELSMTTDISGVLPSVQARTQVLWPRDCQVFPVEGGRQFAELIPGAEFREMPGAATILLGLDVDLLADLVEEFVTGRTPAVSTNRVLASILFTDLVGSTARATELGDRAWSELLAKHHDSLREAVGRFGGRTVKVLGDGILATFSGPAQAVRCADQIITDAAPHDLEVRSGVHTGEIEVGSDDVSGVAVHLAARIMALAGAGEILVSRTVKDLVVGSELRFSDRGEHELKGIGDSWQIYALT